MADGKIVVNARFLTQPLTGTQRYAYNVITRMRDVRLVSPAAPQPHYSNVPYDRLTVAPHLLRSHLWEQFVLPAHVGSDDLLWSPGGMGSLFVRRLVITVTDLAVFENPECYGGAFGRWYRALYPVVANRARRVLTISEFSKEVIQRVLGVPADRIVVTHLGVDDAFRPRSIAEIERLRQRLGLSEHYLLSVGALSPRKNLHRLLQAWRRVSQSYPDTSLVIVGEPNLLFSADSSLGELPPRTTHLTGIDDETLATLYSGAAAFVFPSIYEGFGLPVLEAMAAGTPVVTSNVTSLPEIAGDAAVLMNPYDVGAIADAIDAVLSDEVLRDDLRRRGFARAAQFSWDATARKTWAALQEALG